MPSRSKSGSRSRSSSRSRSRSRKRVGDGSTFKGTIDRIIYDGKMAGCGYIRVPETTFFRKVMGNMKTLFFHKTEVRPGTTLHEGDNVEFVVIKDPTDSKRICASRVSSGGKKKKKASRTRSRSRSAGSARKGAKKEKNVSDRVQKFLKKKNEEKAKSRVSSFLKKVDQNKAKSRVGKFLKKVQSKGDDSRSPSRSASKETGKKRTRSRSADKKRATKRSRVRSASSDSNKSGSSSRSDSPASRDNLLEINNIEPGTHDSLITAILDLCGPVKQWIRKADKTSGTVEFAEEAGKAIAIQILSVTQLRGKMLSVRNLGKPPRNQVIAATAARRPTVEAQVKKLITTAGKSKKQRRVKNNPPQAYPKGVRVKALWFPDKKYYNATVVRYDDKKGVYVIQFDDAGNQHERELKHIKPMPGSRKVIQQQQLPQPPAQPPQVAPMYNPQADAVVVDANARQGAIAAIDFGSKYTKVSVALSSGALLGQLALHDGHDGSPTSSDVLIRLRHDEPNAGKLVSDIMKIGVNENRAKKAVFIGKATELTSAMTWLLQHADEPDIDDDYQPEAAMKVVAFGPNIEESKSIAELQAEDGYTFHVIRDIKAKFIGRQHNEDFQQVHATDGQEFEFSMVVQDTVKFLVDKVKEQCPRLLHSRADVEKIVLTVPTVLQGGSISQEELGSFMIPMHDAIADQRHIPCLTVSEGISALVYICRQAPPAPGTAVMNIDVGAFGCQTGFVYRNTQGKYYFADPAGWILGGEMDNRLFGNSVANVLNALDAILPGTRAAVMNAYEQAKRRQWVHETQAFVVNLAMLNLASEGAKARFDKILDSTACEYDVEMARDGARLVVRLGQLFKGAIENRVNRMVEEAVGYTRLQLANVQKATGRQVPVRVELSGGGARDSLVQTVLERIQSSTLLPNVTVQRRFTSSEAVCLGGLEICRNSEWLEESVTKLQGEVRCRGKDILFPAQTVTYKSLRVNRSYRQAGQKQVKVPISIANECAEHAYLELPSPGATVEVIAEFQTSNKLKVTCRSGQRLLSEEFYYVPVLPTLRQLSKLDKA